MLIVSSEPSAQSGKLNGLTAEVNINTFSNRYHQADSKGHDSKLPVTVTIEVGSKGHDSNLLAIVTISTGSKGHD